MKLISVCPVCKSDNLVQEYYHDSGDYHGPIGPRDPRPPILDGSHCGDCGVVLKFDKAGKCPTCEGTGRYNTGRYNIESRYTLGGVGALQISKVCPTCEGKGELVDNTVDEENKEE